MSERWPALLSTEDAAEYLGVSRSTLKRLQAAERLRPVTIRDGALLRFRRTDLDQFIEDLPFGIGKCAANEKRIAVVMLAKQQAKAVSTNKAKAKAGSKGTITKQTPKAPKNEN